VARETKERGKRLLVVGGSGFYLQAFFSPVIDEVQVSPELRAQVMALEETEGLRGLLDGLRQLNPDGLGGLDEHNPRRVSRALERCLASGKSLRALKTSFQEGGHPFSSHRKITWVLDRDWGDLEQRVRQRISTMLQGGLLDEVRALRDIGLEENPSAARAVGYRETLLYLDGELRRDEWEESIVLATMRLARKQRKWFRSRLSADRTISLSVGETGEDLPAPWEA
ncbi:MAG: tRNA dimethylallyltransferase, partial [Opitutales bacterium]